MFVLFLTDRGRESARVPRLAEAPTRVTRLLRVGQHGEVRVRLAGRLIVAVGGESQEAALGRAQGPRWQVDMLPRSCGASVDYAMLSIAPHKVSQI